MKHLLYVGNKLQQHGYTPSGVDVYSKKFEELGFKVTAVSSIKNKYLRLLKMLFSILRYRNSVDFILIDTYSTQNFYFAFLCGLLAKLLKIKYIPILRGGNLPQRLVKSKKLSNLLFKNAHINIAPSKYLKDAFNVHDFNNVLYIPNSISLKDYEFTPKPIDIPKLLWVRSFVKIYNPKLAIKIFSAIKSKYPEATLCMVGPEKDGSLQNCKAYAEQLNLNVKFTGQLTKQEWRELSNNYNIFINTTNFDNTPVSVIEAMALGLPVISTNVGGLPYLINNVEDGILVPANNPTHFIDAIVSLVENPTKAQELSIHAREKVSNYDWQIVKLNWQKLFT